MIGAELILLAFGAVVLCFDAYAVRRIYLSKLYKPSQLWAQTGLILFVPLFGAYLAIYLCRDRIALFQKPPVDLVQDIDGTCGNTDYHG